MHKYICISFFWATGFGDASFDVGEDTYRLFNDKVDAETAEDRCADLGDDWGLARIPDAATLNAIR